MKKRLIILFLLAALLVPCASGAELAIPKEKILEETTTWESDTLRIEIERWCYDFNKSDLRFFVASIWPKDPAQLQTAFAGEQYSKKNAEATSVIAARHDAVLAVNGDYYNYKDKVGLIIRNGVLYRDLDAKPRDILLVHDDGTFEGIRYADYKAGQGEALVAGGVVQSFCFGPLLVQDGEIVELPPSKKYIIYTDDTIREPRTAIGQAYDGHYVFIVADGRREKWSDKGMALQELQQVFVEKGCRVAYNLDGGGSATLILNGEKLNKSSGSREREVSDIIYFTK